MSLDELTDEQLNDRLRELLPPLPTSRVWEDSERVRLVRFIAGDVEAGHAHPAMVSAVADADRRRVTSATARRPERWRVPVILGSAGAATLLIVGLVVVSDRTRPVADPGAAPVPTAADSHASTGVDAGRWQPPGAPFELVDLGPAEAIGGDVVVIEALTRRVGVETHPPLTVYRSLDYVGDRAVVEWDCLASAGGTGCFSIDHIGPFVGVTSSVNNGIAEFDLWTWSNVPSEAAFVVYDEGTDRRWQTPVGGVAAFPNTDWFDSVAVAYDERGIEVARVDATILNDAAAANTAAVPVSDGLGDAERAAARHVVNDAATRCLADAGAVFDSGSVGRLESDDAEQTWSECAAAATGALDEWLTTHSDVGRDHTAIPHVGAVVTTPSAGATTIEIDRGRTSGVRLGMPVVDAGGLAGTITSVADDLATVTLIHDPSSGTAAALRGGAERVGTTVGVGSAEFLAFESDEDVDATTGPFLETPASPNSALPPGIPIGRLTDTPDRGVVVQPWVNLDDLRQVTVLLYTPARADRAADES